MMGQACVVLGSPNKAAVYKPRRPQETDLYQIIQGHLERFSARLKATDSTGLPTHIARTFEEYLKCGILAYGFGRARCEACGHEYLVAFSCKGRGLCPSCGAKYMSATAAHLVDNVLPRVPYRQWVISLPKRIRYFALHNSKHAAALLRIFLRTIETTMRKVAPQDPKRARIAAVSFAQRFGSSLNQHLHFHSIVSDGLFAPDKSGKESVFFETDPLTQEQVEQLTEKLRRKILSYLVKHGLLDEMAAQEMLTWQHHGGFSVDATVRIEAYDRLALERLVRYCARPPFAESRLTYIEPDRVVYRLPQGAEDGQSHLVLSPLEFIKRVAKLIPPPRKHRHHYFGAIAPNCKLRPYVIKEAGPAAKTEFALKEAAQKMGLDKPQQVQADPKESEPKAKRKASCSWAMLIARIFEVMPLLCTNCGRTMKIIAFVTEPATIKTILNATGEDPVPPQLAQPRAPPQEMDYIDPEPEYDFNQAPAGW